MFTKPSFLTKAAFQQALSKGKQIKLVSSMTFPKNKLLTAFAEGPRGALLPKWIVRVLHKEGIVEKIVD